MAKPYYHQKFFNILYKDMLRRIGKFKQIQKISAEAERRKAEKRFLDEQASVVAEFIREEKRARQQLENGLKLQQNDIEGWWKRNIEFRRVKRNCLNNFDNLMKFAKKVKKILDSGHFGETEIKTLISEIENEALTIINLSDNYEIKKYGEGILAFCKRNKNLVALAALFLLVSSLAIYTFSNYNIIPVNTQTTQVSFTVDDMHATDWAAGAHYSYGFHTMLNRIVDTYLGRKGGHKSYLEGLHYTATEDRRYGNQDANILDITKGASALLPNDMRKALGDDLILEVAALNKGEDEIKIFQNNRIVLHVFFHQDKAVKVAVNEYNFSIEQLEGKGGMYHSIRLGLQDRVNAN